MKQKDVALIIVIAFVSAVASFFLSGKLFVTPANRQQEVEIVDKITPDFSQPDKVYFNSTSIDPTLNTSTSTSANQNPFNGTGQ